LVWMLYLPITIGMSYTRIFGWMLYLPIAIVMSHTRIIEWKNCFFHSGGIE
jgi:hypothetical protein